jgi:hypothetical protein
MPSNLERNTTLQEYAINAAIYLKDTFPDKDLEDYLQSVNLYSQIYMNNESFNIFKIHFEHKLRELFNE